jgi:hypothetical protein
LLKGVEIPAEYKDKVLPRSPRGLKCKNRKGNPEGPCSKCEWSFSHAALCCPWCNKKGIFDSDYKVLHGNPESPAADTEVEFTYTCSHCGLVYWNNSNVFNQHSPTLHSEEMKCFFQSEDQGQTWQVMWID